MSNMSEEYKTNDRSVSSLVTSRRPTRSQASSLQASLHSTQSGSNKTVEDNGELLMRNKVDLDCDVIVLDIGTGSIKAGWAGEDKPRCIVPTLCIETHSSNNNSNSNNSNGQQQSNNSSNTEQQPSSSAEKEKRSVAVAAVNVGVSADPSSSHSHHHRRPTLSAPPSFSWSVGNAALNQLSMCSNEDSLCVIRPLSRGLVVDWESLYKLIDHVFREELRVSPKDHSVLVTCSPLCSSSDRAEMAKMMFDRFSVPALSLVNSATLALFSTGFTTGIVCEMGEGRTTVTPVYEGFALRHAVLTQRCGGQDQTHRLHQILTRKGHDIKHTQTELVRDIKEKLCRMRTNTHTAGTGTATPNAATATPTLSVSTSVLLSPPAVNNKRGLTTPKILRQASINALKDNNSTPSSIHRNISFTSNSNSSHGSPSTTHSTISSSNTHMSHDLDMDNTYELPSGKMLHLDEQCLFDSGEMMFTGEFCSDEEENRSNTQSQTGTGIGGIGMGMGIGGRGKDTHWNEDEEDTRTRSASAGYRLGGQHTQQGNTATSQHSLPAHLSLLHSLHRDHVGLPALLFQSLSMLDSVIRKEMLKHIILAGGVSMTQGIQERMKKEIAVLQEKEKEKDKDKDSTTLGADAFNVYCDSQRQHAAWIGGSMFASLTTFAQLKITSDHYKKDESIVHKRYL